MDEFAPLDPTAPYNPANKGLPQDAFTHANRKAFGQAVEANPTVTFAEVISGKTLKDLIPAEFFVYVVKPVANHGTITLLASGTFKGDILVAWGKGCPLFNENLAAARGLKQAGLGTYRPEQGGWVFARLAAAKVVKAFPATLVVSPEVLALVEECRMVRLPLGRPPEEYAGKSTRGIVHGTIKWDGRQWLVAFGGQIGNAFTAYVNAARAIKNAVAGSKGWQGAIKSWAFDLKAAGRIVQAFPATHFDHSADLLKAAEAYPAPAVVNPVVANRQAEQDAGPDALATSLLAAASLILA
jgi:hypothetical protein